MKKTLSFAIILAYACGFAQESKELSRLKNEMKANVTISNSTSNPNFIYFSQSVKLKSTDAKTKASEFLAENFRAFNLRSANDLVLLDETTDNYGLKNVTYRQQYQGIPVYDGLLKFHFNAKEELSSINGNSISIAKLNTVPDITAAEAEIIARDMVTKQDLNKSNTPLQTAKTNLIIFPKNLMQGGIVTPYLAYQIEVTNKKDVREYIFINAHTGELVEQFTGIHPIDRKLYETNTTATNLKWKEGDAFPGTLSSWQQNEVVTSEHVYNFFKNTFGYVSYDAADHTMITVNNDPTISCPNARWNGTYAGYCDGTATDDVIAHEWGHAYTEYTSGLIYQYQSGALNESYSDVWGETIDLINNYMDEGENLSVRTTTACSGSLRWKVGEDATSFGGAIRDMWNPNCNGDPAKVLDAANYYCGNADSGGVHTNSGVTNHLYALLVDGGTYNGYTMTGMGFVKAAHLWWRAQKNYLTATSDFANFADALEASANDLIGVNLQGLSTIVTPAGLTGLSITSADVQNVKNGILAVQLRTSPATQCNYTPLLAQSAPSLCASATNNPLFKEDWENGLGNWTVTNVPTKPSTWEARDWTIKSNLPKSRPGKAIFAIDPINGDCASNLQNGILRLESPTITMPTFTSGKYEMAFNHYVATESTWDGGNIKYSLNEGSWTLVPVTAFTYNGYNSTLDGTSSNDNPLKGQRAFTGTDGGSLGGSWGQSVIDLSKLGVTSGAKIKFRFEMGTDGCNGVEGWYLDELYVYNCSTLAVEDVKKQNGISVFPNPTSGFITIQNTRNSDLKTVEIYNVAGQLIKNFKLNSGTNKASLDMSQLLNGTYILKVKSESENNTVKVIKK
ncbi:T9SS C-terminal target domain-containing protein [Epilithonimonas vandammei]|uniref:T9SS C-terminal target domain-containing protein n=1 Tax=Epilithonimonas vandammei TaxID=2487072 RepID=A0A3G8ZAS7_9FLAO|nr:M4 family metallopeptidase [Epilithonimonas vandammei]AZI54263.1 T9SS C-terminal target domain-containing protein [Epilithonimonas vandammei]